MSAAAPPADGNGNDAPRVALVLGAGGARGLAHIGVIEAIEARGMRIAAIAGTSMDALVGGIQAAGKLPAYRDWAASLSRGAVLRLLDFGLGRPGLFTGERIIAKLYALVGEHRIEALPVPYTAVATDLRAQREVWLTRGPLFDAIRASMAIPLLFTPVLLDGRELVDGGLLDPVPIAATRQALVDLVVAVDVNAQSGRQRPLHEAPAHTEPEAEPDGVRAKFAAMVGGLLARKAAPAVVQPGLIDLMARSLDTMQGQLARLQLAFDPPDVLIRVSREACLFYEFWRASEMIALGRERAERALDAAGY